MNNKVSVIIPVYNMQEYIEECLNSIINQTLKDIEILCIDDCSNDNSAYIIKDFIIEDKRIKYIKLDKNSGSAIARNIGINEANGEFVIFMDPDDYYYDNTVLERLYLTAKNKNVKVVAGNILAFDVENNLKGKFREESHFIQDKYYSFRNEYYSCFGYQSFLFNTKFLKENNLYFPNYLRRQDPVFFLNVMLLHDNFFAINYNIYVYRLFYKKVNWDIRKKRDFINAYKENFDIFNKENLPYHFMTEFLDFKYHVLLENQFKIDKDISINVENTKHCISYKLLKKGVLSKIQQHEKDYIYKILQKLKDYSNKRIIIYGFGNIGLMLYEQLQNEYTINQIVDKNLYNISVDKHKISSKIDKSHREDIVILTVLNEEVKVEILEELYLLGFSKEQILFN
ncbi:glycosyltransferase [Aliarcobacter lanthieri]|uniref:glycosyltransferase family 2 protein n=1 Tax=Aliarcobacter lanthieri TaxID=1355374 RepID=UPI0004B80C44|nr:glycosyltransferase family 2 protein [Aliarcobacter lanthieri]QKF60187.1 glycosyltransferase, family 2 [Aliarcobacter lanthieri]